MEAKFFGRNQRDIVFIHYHLYAGWRTALCLLSKRYVPRVFWNDIFCHVEIIQEKLGMRPFAPELKLSQIPKENPEQIASQLYGAGKYSTGRVFEIILPKTAPEILHHSR